jgi:hypothetical protein
LKSKLVVAKPHQKMLTDFSELKIDINLYRAGQFYWYRKLEYPGKTTDMSLTN